MILKRVLSQLSDKSRKVISCLQKPHLTIRRKKASSRPISTTDRKPDQAQTPNMIRDKILASKPMFDCFAGSPELSHEI